MDQNQFRTEQFYQQTPVVKNASYYRARARKALSGKYLIAVLAFLIASILGGILSGGGSVSFHNSDEVEVEINSEEAVEAELRELGEAVATGDIGFIFERYPFLAVGLGMVAAGAVFHMLLSFFVGSPVALGYQKFNLDLIDGKEANLGTLFSYFKNTYGKSLLVRLVYALISFACSLPLLLVTFLALLLNRSNFAVLLNGDISTGVLMPIFFSLLVVMVVAIFVAILEIVVAYHFYFSFMIIAEYPELGVLDAFRNSFSLMRGNKWRLFCLHFSFIGWALLAICCTCGIGVIFLTPYIYAADAAFYDDIANRAAARETEFPSLDPDDYDPNQTKF